MVELSRGRLSLTVRWTEDVSGGGRVFRPWPGVAIVLHDLVPAPDDERWLGELLGCDGRIVGPRPMSVATELGWPATVVQHTTGTGEVRLAVVYRFFHFLAAAVVHASSLDVMESCRFEAVAGLMTARPMFGARTPASITAFFES